MSFSHKQNSGGVPTTLSEINVTPFVDVMLVLLIIFMISAPLMKQGTQIDLPKANSGTLQQAESQIFLTITTNREIRLDDKPVHKGQLRARLAELARKNSNAQIYIQADQALPYGLVAQVIAEVKQAGLARVGLVTQPGAPGSDKAGSL